MSDPHNKTWLVLDGNFLCARHYYATGKILDGISYSFFRDIVLLTQQFATPNIVFCWDYGLNKRYSISNEYKKKRRNPNSEDAEEKKNLHQEIDNIKTLVNLIGYKNSFQNYGYEADDVIASVVRSFPLDNQVYVISADEDLYQLIDRNVICYNPTRKSYLGYEGFKKQYGIDPSDWKYVKAIAGCSSDNIKGVPLIGEKKAIKYLRGEGTEKEKEKIVGHGDIIKENLKLVSLPYPGTGNFTIQKDKVSTHSWNAVMAQLNNKTLYKEYPMGVQLG